VTLSARTSLDVIIALATALVLWFGARLVIAREPSDSPSSPSVRLPVQDFAKYMVVSARLPRRANA
jgi:hypothetical protein